MAETYIPGNAALADVGQRVLARIVDALIMVPVFLILISRIVANAITEDGDPSTGALFAGALIGTAIGAAYEILMTANGGQTIGKKVMKIRVIRLSDGQTPDLQTATMRWLPNGVGLLPTIGSLLSFVIFIASLVLVFQDPRRQSVNDKLAKTVVVQAN